MTATQRHHQSRKVDLPDPDRHHADVACHHLR
jgi:hypothetical protein